MLSKNKSRLRAHLRAHKRTLLLAAAAVSLCSAATATRAQIGPLDRSNLTAYAIPAPPPLPHAGSKAVDPTFGAEILRVTDESDGANGGTAYSYWPTFNRDNTRLFVLADGSVCSASLYTFDPVNFQITSKAPLALKGGNTCPQIEGATWSGTDPDVLYVSIGAAVYAYDARTRAYSTAFDLSSRLPYGHYFFQMSMSLDNDVVACTLRNSSYQQAGYLAYRRSTDEVLYQSADDHDEVHVDKSGRYLFISTGQQGAGKIQGRVRDLQTGATTDLRDDAPDYAPGHFDVGTGTIFGADNWVPRVTGRSLSSPREVSTVLDLSGEQEWGAYHVSMLADDERWALVGFHGWMANGVMQGEVVQVSTDGAQRVRRLFHHHSVFRDYYDSPRANISRDGRFVAFTSNWGSAGGRRDLFVARITPASGQSATPTPTPTPTPTATATATPTPTPTPAPTPPFVSTPLVAAAHATCSAMAAGASNSAEQFDALLAAIDQALAAFAAERARLAEGDQIEMALRSSRHFASAARALAQAEPGLYPAGAQSRLQIAASRLAQARSLLPPATGTPPPGEQAHAGTSAMPPPIIGVASTLSAASLAPVVSPASLATIVGDAARSPLANYSATAAKLARPHLPYELAGASVTIAGRAAPLLHASPSRLSFVVPAGLPLGEAEVIVTSQDGYVSSGTVAVDSIAPALFTRGDTNEAVAFNASGVGGDWFDVHSPSNLGFDKRTRLSLLSTGLSSDAALNTYQPNDVRASASLVLLNFAESVAAEARLTDGRTFLLPVDYAGALLSTAGVDQVNLLLTQELRGAGRVEITLVVAGRRSNTVSVNVR